MTGFEPLIAAGARALFSVATPIIQDIFKNKLKKNGKKLISEFSVSLDERIKRSVFYASKKYIKNYRKRHGFLKVLGMREPVNLESVDTTVQILNNCSILQFDSVHEIEKSFRKNPQRQFSYRDRKISKKKGIDVANEKQLLMVLGAPGSGKSTFLRKIALEALKGKKGAYKDRYIPVLLELQIFDSDDIDITKAIIEEFKTCRFPEASNFTAKALEQGKLLILFDGLDEVPTKYRNQVIDKIEDFVDKHNKNRFITSGHLAAYPRNFHHFSYVVMADFDDQQIEQFINNWFHSEADKTAKTAENCWKLLQEPRNAAAKELAQTPLLLTFLCFVYDKSQKFPNNRSSLYSKALRILLEEWAAEKRVPRDEIYQGLHTELEEILLSEIAYKNFKQDRLFFEKREIVSEIKNFLAGNLNAPQNINGEKVLNAIAVQQGILFERAKNIFSFSHITLQEYLTAQYIVDNILIKDLVQNHASDKRWKEVFLLVAGLMRGGADNLLLAMEQEAQKFLETPMGKQRLVPILNWAESITQDSRGNLKPVVKLSFANAYALANSYAYTYAKANAYANAYALTNTYAKSYDYAIANAYAYIYTNSYTYALTNAYANAKANAYTYANSYVLAYTLANAYTNPYFPDYNLGKAISNALERLIKSVRELQQLPEVFGNVNYTVVITGLKALTIRIPYNESREIRQAFAKRIIGTWLEAFHLTPGMVNIPKEELREIDTNYFYIYWLMVQCKQSAVRVLPQNWEGIEDRMLRVI